MFERLHRKKNTTGHNDIFLKPGRFYTLRHCKSGWAKEGPLRPTPDLKNSFKIHSRKETYIVEKGRRQNQSNNRGNCEKKRNQSKQQGPSFVKGVTSRSSPIEGGPEEGGVKHFQVGQGK